MENDNQERFIGRHQQVLSIKQLLGEDVTSMEMQIAANKDLSERNQVIEKLEELEEYVKSDYFTNQFDVASANKNIGEIIDIGYKTCVLQNEVDLEDRCLKILEDTIEYTKKFGNKNGTLTEEESTKLDDILKLRVAVGFLSWWTLGDLFDTSEEQHAWMIVSSLVNTGKPIVGFNKSDLVSSVVSTLSLKDLDGSVERFRNMKEVLLNNKKITDAEAERVEELILKGIENNRIIHKEHPDRT